jgi:FMN phosphatase YigB (HAD superfamily)
MPHRPPQALLFDLGGVLLDIDFDRALQAWAPYSTLSLAELRTVFTHDLPYELHERGDIDAAAYFDHLARTLKLSASHAQIEQGWNAIFVGEFEATRQSVASLRGTLPCHAFSNTNASHMAVWSERFPKMVNAFDRIFTSHELRLRKPEREAFDRICGLTGVPAESFLFFDDLPVNVQAARDAGFQAVLVRSPDDVATALESLGLVRRGA